MKVWEAVWPVTLVFQPAAHGPLPRKHPGVGGRGHTCSWTPASKTGGVSLGHAWASLGLGASRHLEGAREWGLVWLGMKRVETSPSHAFDLCAYRRPQWGNHH